MGSRFAHGFGWGIAATIAMSALMLAGMLAGMSPMPKPIPLAIVARILGQGVPQPFLIAAAVTAHLLYGGLWGGAFAARCAPVTVPRGLGLGVYLWALMQLIVLPFLGWGVFGAAVTPAIAVATLVLHLIYGATSGALIDRHQIAVPSSPRVI